MRMATTTRYRPRSLSGVWRRAGRLDRLAVTGPAVGLLALCVAMAALGLSPSPAEATAPLPVPATHAAAIQTAALSCPALTAPRLAAQLMVASGFDERTNTPNGASGIAGLTDAEWQSWRPAPGALRGDPAANILALAHLMCELTGQVRAAGLPGDPWTLALAAFYAGLPPVVQARAVPAAAADYVARVASYADWYARQPGSDGAESTPPERLLATTAAPPDASVDTPLAIPDDYVADIIAAGQRCPTVTPPRIAAQLMAESGFNPNLLNEAGAQGIAQFRPELWSTYRPSPEASAWDPRAAIPGLGVAMCALVDRLRGSAGDPYQLALVAFHSGIDAPLPVAAAAATVPMRNFVQAVLAYADVYSDDSRLSPLPTPDPTSAPAPAAAGSPVGWQLTWSDEFDGAAGDGPDPGRWSHDIGGGGWGNAELQYYTDSPANASLDGDGHLAITAAESSSAGLPCWYGACRYTSARLVTLGRFTQAYGRLSARIALPAGQGVWPSFWALGDTIGSVGWPQAGELNVMNAYGHEPATVMGGLHGPGYHAFSSYALDGGTFAGSYHTFTADWYPDHITFSVDGQPYHTQYRVQAGDGWVFDHPFFLVLNVAVGGDQPGAPDATTQLPQRMLVDWVRVYRAGPPTEPVTGQIKHLAGTCVEAATGTTAPAIQLNGCTGAANQRWTFGSDGTVRTDAGCLDLSASSPTNGTRATLTPCRGAPGQLWLAQTNGQLFNPASGRCLDATDNRSADRTPLQVWECWGAANQRWTVA